MTWLGTVESYKLSSVHGSFSVMKHQMYENKGIKTDQPLNVLERASDIDWVSFEGLFST